MCPETLKWNGGESRKVLKDFFNSHGFLFNQKTGDDGRKRKRGGGRDRPREREGKWGEREGVEGQTDTGRVR